MRTHYDIYFNYVYAIYQNKITTGSFLPSEDDIAKNFHVSRPTVRKALKKLNEAGLTETINGVGTKVIFDPCNATYMGISTILTEDYIKIIKNCFTALSLLVTACANQIFDTLDDDDIAFFEFSKQRFDQISSISEWIKTYKINFYEYFVRRTKNKFLYQAYKTLFNIFMPSVNLAEKNNIKYKDIKKMISENGELVLTAIKKRDKLETIRGIKKHYEDFYGILSSRAIDAVDSDGNNDEVDSILDYAFNDMMPINSQIFLSILCSIYAGKYKYDEELPSQLKLAEIYKTTRTTIIKSLTSLEKCGVIKAKANKRYYVNIDLSSYNSFAILYEYMNDSTYSPKQILEAFSITLPYVCGLSVSNATDEDIKNFKIFVEECDKPKTTSQNAAYIFKKCYDSVAEYTHNPIICKFMFHLISAVFSLLPFYFSVYPAESHLQTLYIAKFKNLERCYETHDVADIIRLYSQYSIQFQKKCNYAISKITREGMA